MKITWYGTASISFATENGKVLFDPFLPAKGSRIKITPSDFSGFGDIVATHAHFDHISSLPQLYQNEPRRIYGTGAVRDALTAFSVPESSICLIESGSCMSFGDISVTAYKSRHVRYDIEVLLRTFVNLRLLIYGYNFMPMFRANKICREKNETLAYLIEAEGKRIFLLGSMNLDEQTEYPTGVDLLVLPYQGTSELLATSIKLVEKLQPKAIFLDHFDNSFPPVSHHINTKKAEAHFSQSIPVYKPQYRKSLVF